MLGNSDIHDPITGYEIYEDPELTHRPVTLVFAKEKTAEALKEALLDGRTAVWHKNRLIGREKYLDAIFKASVKITKPYYRQKDTIWCEIKNSSCMDIQMEKAGTERAEKLVLPANSTTLLKTKVKGEPEQAKLSYVVKNFLIAPGKGLPVDIITPLK
jgi:hypothetical protein